MKHTLIVGLLTLSLSACQTAADRQDTVQKKGKVVSPLSGIEIENIKTRQFFPIYPSAVSGRYWWTHPSIPADFNSDGILDLWVTGVQQPDRDAHNYNGKTTADICGKKAYCSSPLTKPSLFIGKKNGTFKLRDDLVVDNRQMPGQSLARQNLIADYNGDKRLDVYIADHAIGNNNGIRDSYFLSQPDGTLLESSDTHLSNPNFRVFDHGAATGDIDNDGDMDIVITDLRSKVHCLMNDGRGHMRKRQCGNIFAFAIELADIDGDNDLDLIHAAHEFEANKGNKKTGVALNNGRGNFRYRSIPLPMTPRWGTVPEVSAWDLDDDGDQDIVLSRAGKLYVGTAIEILENLGDGAFNSKLYELSVAPTSFVAQTEGSHWNSFIQAIRFIDADRDGDTDIVMVTNGSEKLPDGSIMRNDGNMKFTYVKNSQNNGIKVISQSRLLR